MNLNKIEKAFVIILVVGAIIALGIFFLIVPANDEIKAAQSRLDALKVEEEGITAQLAEEPTIDANIEEAKKAALELEGGFYPDLTTYEAIEIILAYIEEYNLSTLAVSATQLSTRDLALEVYTETPVIYDLKTYSQNAREPEANPLLEGQFKDGDKVYTVTANSLTDISITDEEGNIVEKSDYTDVMADAHKEALCNLAVSTATHETVGVTQVSLEVKGRHEDYLNFINFIFDLERASYMENVVIPMTTSVEEDELSEEEAALNAAVEELTGLEAITPCDEDTPVTQSLTIRFLSVEQMEELETIDASGKEIVVNQ